MQPFRVEPQLPVQAYKTYELRAPLASHWRPASCAETGCEAYEHGWRTVVDETTPLGQQQAAYIRSRAGRAYREERSDEPAQARMTVFVFPAGQPCFRAGQHRVPLEREPLYIVRGGDWRGTTGDQRQLNAAAWVDDFATHQNNLAEQIEKG